MANAVPSSADRSSEVLSPASDSEVQEPLAPPAGLVAEPDPALDAFHAERHSRFQRVVSALRGRSQGEAA